MPAQIVPPEKLAQRSPLAAELTLRRVNLGLSQQAVANAVGVHVYTIYCLETDRAKVSAATMAKIKAVLRWED